MSKTFRAYEFERDASGMPTKMYWLGDFEAPHHKTKVELQAEKLAEHERIYGKREAQP